jgi:hypothetical protein
MCTSKNLTDSIGSQYRNPENGFDAVLGRRFTVQRVGLVVKDRSIRDSQLNPPPKTPNSAALRWRAELKQLCRYTIRPAITNERLKDFPDA